MRYAPKNRCLVLAVVVIISLVYCSRKMPEVVDGKLKETRAEHAARMAWWRDARFGMFIHWGLYAIPAGRWEGESYPGYSEWLMNQAKIPIEQYETLAPQFNPVKYDAEQWVSIAKNAGMKYIIITSKHHDGFCLWDSKYTDYDIVDATPYKRDILKQLSAACKRNHVRLGFYHSILDWHHPDYLPRREWDLRPTEYADFNRYIDHMQAQLTELITAYAPISVIWFDGGWEHDAETYHAREVAQYLYHLKPDLIINNRIALPLDFGTPEQRIPDKKITENDWETCMTINGTWGYHQDDHNWKSSKELIQKLADIATKGGNFLLNVGPTAEGLIPEQSVRVLEEMGTWMKANGESIYGTQASPFAETPWGGCTQKRLPDGNTRLFLHIFNWHADRLSIPGLGNDPVKAYLLTQPDVPLKMHRDADELILMLPEAAPDSANSVAVLDFAGEAVTFHPPEIDAPASLFVHPMDITIEASSKNLEIRCIFEGNAQVVDSLKNRQVIRILETTVVEAQSFYNGKPASEPVLREFRKVQPLPACGFSEAPEGLHFDYYEGEWDSLPDFDSLLPDSSGVASGIDLIPAKRGEFFGLRFDGYLSVPSDDVYTFALASDDGSRLFVGNELVIENDGLHGAKEVRGEIALGAGLQPMTLLYFNKQGGKALRLRMGRMGEELLEIPAERFKRQD
ncbi:alpha-L-fucosidase [candidate division KSB1 bacterium]|nr:alpha-L-fucosidase [candidate division KSB1 bacterium]